MSADERILRLENAMATLAELSANQEQRTARLEESFRRFEEGLRRFEAGFQRFEEGFRRFEESFAVLTQVVADQQRRTTRLEEALVTLTGLTHSHHDSIDELRAAEAEWKRWAAEAERRIAALAESQGHSDRRMDALIDIVRNRLGGETGT